MGIDLVVASIRSAATQQSNIVLVWDALITGTFRNGEMRVTSLYQIFLSFCMDIERSWKVEIALNVDKVL